LKGRFSDLKALRSAVRYYTGTTFCDASADELPGSRDSRYFGTKEPAQKFLADLAVIADKEEAPDFVSIEVSAAVASKGDEAPVEISVGRVTIRLDALSAAVRIPGAAGTRNGLDFLGDITDEQLWF